MREIKKLGIEDIDAYHKITVNAYPQGKDLSPEGIETYKEDIATMLREEEAIHFYGLFEGDELFGVMRIFDFHTNLFGKMEIVTGLGFLSVDMGHKKQKIARDLIKFFEEDSLERGYPVGTLLPFRPDFYKSMGYGYGTKYNQYVLRCKQFPKLEDKSQVRILDKEEMPKLVEFQRTLTEKTHGMAYKTKGEIQDFLEDEELRIAATDEAGELKGYMLFEFTPGPSGNYFDNDLVVRELAYETPRALRELLGFLHEQADQVSRVFMHTADPDFHYLLDNPTRVDGSYVDFGNLEANHQFIGPMYKLFDFEKALKKFSHRNYHGVNLKIKLEIYDEFKDKVDEIVLSFLEGALSLDDKDYDVVAKLKLADLSSLYMGAVSAYSLYRLGRMKVDKVEYLDRINQAFMVPQMPVFNTDF